MKTIISVMLLTIIFYSPYNYLQQQQHIPWPSLADSPWPVGRGDAQATGRSKYIGPRTPNVTWRKDMRLGIFHGPVIGYNDELFFGTRAFNTQATENYFYSVDKNREKIWTFTTQQSYANSVGATITYDGTIYFISGGSGGLHALNPDGTLKWKNERFIMGLYTRYISVGKNHNIYLPWVDTLYVLEPEGGEIIDSFYMPGMLVKEVVFSTGGDTIFYISGDIHSPGTINGATITGEHLWSKAYNHHNWGTPLVDNKNRIYGYGFITTPSSRFLYCINSDGTGNWQYLMNNNPYETLENYSSPTIDSNGNIIFQTSMSDSGYITSVDYTGNVNWKTTLGHYLNNGARINSGLVCDAEGKIYCGSTYGFSTNFWCLDSDGTILWKLDLEGYQYDTSPAINSEGTLYIGSHGGSLFQNNERNLIAINDTILSGVENEHEMTFHLYQNYPNPFNPSTHIDFVLMERTNVTLKVFNLLGEEIRTLVNEEMIPGYYSRIFDGKDLSSGIYFYTLCTGSFTATKKILLLK